MATDLLGPIIENAIDKLKSAAAASGYFEVVLTHEPKSAPSGLAFATWLEDIQPVPERSGLDVTTARVLMICRVYRNMLADPQDSIDVELGKASSYMLAELTGDFGIDGAYIDLLGAHGDPLNTVFGYVDLDKTMFRVADTEVPFIADNVFDQEV